MKISKNDYFFDFKTLTLKHKSLKYKKKEIQDIYKKSKKDSIFIQLLLYTKPQNVKRLKLKKFFLSQLFIENKKIFKLIGFLNRHFLKKMFLKKKYMNNVLVSIERRLDINLVRSRLLPSIKMAQQAIKYGFVFVNKEKMTSDKYIVKQFDVITLDPNFFFLTTLPYIQSHFIRYKLKQNSYFIFKNLLQETFTKISARFNVNILNLLLNKAQVSIFTKIQILILLSLFFTKKHKFIKKTLLNKIHSKFYYITRVKLNYKGLVKTNKKINKK